MTEIKRRTFHLLPQDIDWMKEIRKRANEGSLSALSYSQILKDLIEFARVHGYEYGNR